ncbi:hypothetical protein [[Mycoplasma] gypis]|uniref:Ribbon-helix-helix protein CopG domain-containing protein n=1 Tax=[Mycoplasma] gypis TaxID=92404 RepID=A0ABZ2RQ09_9BACT|nr:hypothetical protein [[Mycoplasma] gypis]MBN0919380.1 hypothetical protein [[Mycoplasma] gypis]
MSNINTKLQEKLLRTSREEDKNESLKFEDDKKVQISITISPQMITKIKQIQDSLSIKLNRSQIIELVLREYEIKK